MNILRIITPEEIGEITTKHNGGKFLSLTDLIDERLEKNILRDFSSNETGNNHEAKILPFKRGENRDVSDMPAFSDEEGVEEIKLIDEVIENNIVNEMTDDLDDKNEEEAKDHQQDENMSSFILIEKERFKKSQQVLKKKEIMELYQQTSKVEVEQIKHSNQNLVSSALGGVLVNKKQY